MEDEKKKRKAKINGGGWNKRRKAEINWGRRGYKEEGRRKGLTWEIRMKAKRKIGRLQEKGRWRREKEEGGEKRREGERKRGRREENEEGEEKKGRCCNINDLRKTES